MSRISQATANATRTGAGVAPPQFNTARDRNVPTQTVTCPTCHATIGEPCTTAKGKSTPSHGSRRRMALRAENAVYDVDDVMYARHLTASERHHIRLAVGLSQTAVAREIRTTCRTVGLWESGMTPSGPLGARYGAWLRQTLGSRA